MVDVPERVGRDAGILVLGDLFAFAQDLRNAAGRDVLFRNDQVHGSYASLFFSASVSIRFSVCRVGFPAGLLHDLPDKEVERPGFAGPVILERLGIFGDGFFDGGRDGAVIPGGLCKVQPLHDCIGCLGGLVLQPLVEHDPEDFDPALIGDRSRFQELDKAGHGSRLNLVKAHVPVIQLADQGIGNPGGSER